ncbi:MAG: hypothetical protein ACKVW3_05750 [Phycisphaerales bacterium]
MATTPNRGQRSDNASKSGQKQRSPTSTSHKGSRVEPSSVKGAKKGTRIPRG